MTPLIISNQSITSVVTQLVQAYIPRLSAEVQLE
jgi:hypothetical protein